MRAMNIAVVIAAISTAFICDARAQVERPGTPPSLAQPADQNPCPPGGSGSPRPDDATGRRPLSDQLAESKGVICPPAGTDPGIAVPPRGGGRTPVIPPPGTPGGDPNIQPK